GGIWHVMTAAAAATRSSFWLATAMATAFLMVVVVAENWGELGAELIPSGDFAADALLVDRANHDWLLVGHYSRFKFNHPGPFFLYLRPIAEWWFAGYLPAPFNAHLLAVFGTAAFFLGMGSAGGAALAGGGRSGAIAAMASLAAALLQGGRSGM